MILDHSTKQGMSIPLVIELIIPNMTLYWICSAIGNAIPSLDRIFRVLGLLFVAATN